MSRKQIDKGGRVFLVEGGKVYEGYRSRSMCGKCAFARNCEPCDLDYSGMTRRQACGPFFNGNRGNRNLRPVSSGAVS